MKKIYEKPQILFDSFTLTTNISAGCEVKTNLPHWNQCGVDFSGLMVFMSGMSGCTDIQVVNDGEDFNGICYHVPVDANNVFAS